MEENVRDGSSTSFLRSARELNKPLTFREALELGDAEDATTFRYTEQTNTIWFIRVHSRLNLPAHIHTDNAGILSDSKSRARAKTLP